jgi:hypothetical protein
VVRYLGQVVRWSGGQVPRSGGQVVRRLGSSSHSPAHTQHVRYVLWLHFTFLVNSAAHLFGKKPYDKNIGPSENR